MSDELQGSEGAPFRMVVEEGKVREFATAVGSDHPDHHRAHDPVSPVTFLMSAAFWQSPAESEWGGDGRDLARILHGGQHFVFHGPPPAAGTELVGVQRVDRVYTKEGRRGGAMTFTEVVTEFRTSSDGQPVAEMRSTTIETAKAPTEAP